jgi:hypothetical protein
MGKLAGERLEKIQSLRARCLAIIDACDTLIAGGSREAAEKAMNAAVDAILPGSTAFKMLDTQGEKTMEKMDSNRRKDLLEARNNCKSWLAAIETELAEDNAEKSAALELHSPEMKAAILEARQQPAFKSASLSLR